MRVFLSFSVIILLTAFLVPRPLAAKSIETPFEYQVYGWTNDSQFWSYSEKGDYGCGMVYSPGIGFYVIDAIQNKFHYKFFKTTKYLDDDDVNRANKQVDGWQKDNLSYLKKKGLSNITGTVVYHKPKGTWLDYDSVMSLNGEKTASFKYNNDQFTVTLDDEYIEDETIARGKKSKFKIEIKKNGGPVKILQSDKSFWRNFVDYGIVYISISPDNKKIAILVEAVAVGLEGTKESRFLGTTGDGVIESKRRF